MSKEQKIHAIVDSIPAGRVATYSQVAREAGLPHNARLVGATLGHLPAGSRLPWHRVINAQGKLSQRGGGEVLQRERLEAEGVRFDARGRIDLATYAWTPSW